MPRTTSSYSTPISLTCAALLYELANRLTVASAQRLLVLSPLRDCQRLEQLEPLPLALRSP